MLPVVSSGLRAPWGIGMYVLAVSFRIRTTPIGTTHFASSDGVTYFISKLFATCAANFLIALSLCAAHAAELAVMRFCVARNNFV